jgi:hypothetical protein
LKTDNDHIPAHKEEIMATELETTIDNVKEKLTKLREYL